MHINEEDGMQQSIMRMMRKGFHTHAMTQPVTWAVMIIPAVMAAVKMQL